MKTNEIDVFVDLQNSVCIAITFYFVFRNGNKPFIMAFSNKPLKQICDGAKTKKKQHFEK